MSFLFPYFGFPSFRRSRYNPYYNKQNPSSSSPHKKEDVHKNNSYKNTYYSNLNQNNYNKKKSEEQNNKNEKEENKEDQNAGTINIFGLKLNSDDILIIGILFLLYKEGVKDQGLFITLILLLLDR